MYDWDGKVERQRLKKEQKAAAKAASRPKLPHRAADGRIKARRCINCGHWIQKRKLFYLGREMGVGWIHIFVGWRSIEDFQRHECYGDPGGP